MRRFRGTALLLTAVAVLLALFALDHANSGSSYQQASPAKVVSLINQGRAESALISDTGQTIQVTVNTGKRLEASWASGRGSQLRNALQAQLDKGGLPGGYSVIIAKSSALLDVLAPAFIYLVIFLLFMGCIDYPAEIRRWRAVAGQAPSR
jgi:cell division protease FtsH